MEVSTALLLRTPLFRGIPQEALPALLEGLGARKRRCGRGEVVLRRETGRGRCFSPDPELRPWRRRFSICLLRRTGCWW